MSTHQDHTITAQHCDGIHHKKMTYMADSESTKTFVFIFLNFSVRRATLKRVQIKDRFERMMVYIRILMHQCTSDVSYLTFSTITNSLTREVVAVNLKQTEETQR